VPPCLIEEQNGMGARRDMIGDFLQMHVHGLAVAAGHDDTSALSFGWTDGTEEPG
jgi:hypothetical protein